MGAHVVIAVVIIHHLSLVSSSRMFRTRRRKRARGREPTLDGRRSTVDGRRSMTED
jgi:hypothetical protein|tara:strand:- start:308 stop:475 length:168 start_codon:yes stop_codon:yes gene_type:complete